MIERSIIGEGSEIYGEVRNSVIGSGVVVGQRSRGSRDSIIMHNSVIQDGAVVDKAIIAEDVTGGQRRPPRRGRVRSQPVRSQGISV